MRRLLLQSAVFVRTARRVVKKNPETAPLIQAALETLARDAFHPALKTHKLKGELAGSWACSASYELRIVFEFVDYDGTEAILLQTVGTHDEVY